MAGAQIGICGGHQILAAMHGSPVGPMRRLREGEEDPVAGYMPGVFKEWGVQPVEVVADDSLFRGLPRSIRVQEYHAWEVRRLGRALRLIATAPGCRIQAYSHRSRPIWGVQFHPEVGPRRYPHGAKVLRNFFALARGVARSAARARR